MKFIKMDSEGHDFGVFRSLRPIVERCRPILECEINRNMQDADRENRASLPQHRTFDILAIPREKPERAGRADAVWPA